MLQSLNIKYPNVVNSNLAAGNVPTVTGYALALSRGSASERAFTAAKLVLGRLALIEPRVTQAARLARVSEPYVEAALLILRTGDSNLEDRVLRGLYPLSTAAVLALYPEPTLTEKFQDSSAAERADLTKNVGVTAIWDELIAPNI
jgi:hypothetical protein